MDLWLETSGRNYIQDEDMRVFGPEFTTQVRWGESGMEGA